MDPVLGLFVERWHKWDNIEKHDSITPQLADSQTILLQSSDGYIWKRACWISSSFPPREGAAVPFLQQRWGTGLWDGSDGFPELMTNVKKYDKYDSLCCSLTSH